MDFKIGQEMDGMIGNKKYGNVHNATLNIFTDGNDMINIMKSTKIKFLIA